MTNPRVMERLAPLLEDLEQYSRKRQEREAEDDPERFRMSTIIADRKPVSYRYYVAKKTKSSEHRWCYASWKNIGGYYLVWYEIENRDTIKRSRFDAEKTRKDARAYCRRMASK